MDSYWAQLDALGAVIALTADHGMNAKHDAAGEPNIIYLQDEMDRLLSPGAARVILPITTPPANPTLFTCRTRWTSCCRRARRA
jgi:phosphonoacetate hydrolase